MQIPTTGSRLIVVCGLPGSGKTTHARRLEERLCAIRFCPDEWLEAVHLNLHDEAARERVESLQWDLSQRLLASGHTVIIEWGTWGRWERDRLRMRARELGAAVELHYLTAPMEVLFARIQDRDAERPPIRWSALAKWEIALQVPTPEEMGLFDEPASLVFLQDTSLSFDSDY